MSERNWQHVTVWYENRHLSDPVSFRRGKQWSGWQKVIKFMTLEDHAATKIWRKLQQPATHRLRLTQTTSQGDVG